MNAEEVDLLREGRRVTAKAIQPRPFGVVRFMATDTGEVKERAMAGLDPPWADEGERERWRLDSLDLALALVPDLMGAIDRARLRGRCVDVLIRDAELAEST